MSKKLEVSGWVGWRVGVFRVGRDQGGECSGVCAAVT